MRYSATVAVLFLIAAVLYVADYVAAQLALARGDVAGYIEIRSRG